MNFLVDRCAGRRLTQWLQSQGHDALDVGDLGPDPGDRALLERGRLRKQDPHHHGQGFRLTHPPPRKTAHGAATAARGPHGPENHPCRKPDPQPPPSPRRTGDHNRNERQNPHLKTTATMTTTNNLDALFADAEPPLGHPGAPVRRHLRIL